MLTYFWRQSRQHEKLEGGVMAPQLGYCIRYLPDKQYNKRGLM